MDRNLRLPVDESLLVVGFIASLVNPFLLLAITLIMPLLLIFISRKKGAILSFIFIQLRSIVNPGMFSTYSGLAGLAKWAVVFFLSFYIIIHSLSYLKDNRFRNAILLVSLFSLYCMIDSIFVSSYPIVAAFKVFSFFIPFIAVALGVISTPYVDWNKKITIPLGIMLFTSVIVFRNPVGYYRNGYAFQGFFSHPNVYGVMLALFVAGYVYYKKRIGFKEAFVIGGALLLAVTSGSRTGIFSIIIALTVFLLTLEMRRGYRILIIVAIVIGIVLITMSTGVSDVISRIVYKGHYDSLLFSRQTTITRIIDRFKSHPLTGTGFNVPYAEGVKSWSFSFELVVENLNLVLALLADTGIIGLVLFLVAYGNIYTIGKGLVGTLFLVPIAVSMGEMSFFSTNNFGIIIYFMISVYLVDGVRRTNSSKSLSADNI